MIMIMLARQNINACDGFERRKKRMHYPAHYLLRLFFVLFFLSVLCLCPVVCLAEEGDEGAFEETVSIVDPISREEGYSAILYNNTNGLPTSEANDIAETSDGFIWIGSYSGLVRYDGVNFERMASTTGITSVKCLYVDSRDRLWIGTNESGVAVMENGKFRMWSSNDGLGSSSVRDITEDSRGVIYVATTGGISMIDSDMRLLDLREPEIYGAFISHMRTSRDGLVYGVTNPGDVFTIKEGKMDSFISHSEFAADGVNCMYLDPENPGHAYIETMDGIVRYGLLENHFQEIKTLDVAPLSQVQSFEYIDGKLWICSRKGIGVLTGDEFHYLDKMPLNNSAGDVMADYEGNLWFTSTRQGVMKITPNIFTDIFSRHALPERVVNSTCMYEDKLFIASDDGLTVLDENGEAVDIPLTKARTVSGVDLQATDLVQMLSGIRIRSAISDSKGNLWLSTWRQYGLLRYRDGEVTAFTAADGMFSDQVRTVCERRDGSYIAAVTGGVNVIEGNQVVSGYAKHEGITNTEILTVTEAENGDILCGTDGGGIFILSGTRTVHIGTESGLTSGAVMRIKKDLSRDIYWIVTGNSLAYLTENYQLVTVDTFPYSNNFDLYENSRGEVWILSSNGIYIALSDDLVANQGIEPLHYGISDGLPCIATANSYSALTEKGDLYIAGTTGVAKVNIEAPYESIGVLKAAIPYVDADGTRLYPDDSGSFTIESGVRKLTVYGFVYNYSLINPQVSYRLEGFDSEYTTVSRNSLAPVDYTNLRGGNYQFVLRLQEPVTRRYKTISVSIVKEKAFYEHIWFFVLSGMIAALAIGLCVNAYIRKKEVQLEKKHRERAEQERIASELSMANRIQASMLPGNYPAFPDRTDFDVFATMDPAKEVGGDFYDFFLIDDDHLGLVIADVSGKGIPAALFMMIAKSLVKNCAMLGRSPAEILETTNESICANNKEEMFVTVWVGILELTTGKLTAANAGHEYPTIKRADSGFELYKDKHGFVIGGMEGMVYKEYTINLSPGDKMFLYTDGVPEATDRENRLFGTERMLAALNSAPEASPQDILRNVRRAVDLFVQNEEQFDDLTMLCIEYKGG